MKITYSYDRYDGPAPGGNNFCSNHHVLPYHLMYLIGIICLALARQKNDDDPYDYLEKVKALVPTQLGNLGNTMQQIVVDGSNYVFPKDENVVNATGGLVNVNLSLPTVIGEIAWLQYNIFKGPRGLSRADDPSQLAESEKPASFPKERWENLASLLNMYSGIGKKSAATRGQRINFEVDYVKAKAIAQFFLNKINPNTPAHQTVVGDWVVRDTDGNYYKCSINLKSQEKYNSLVLSTKSEDAMYKGMFFHCARNNITTQAGKYVSVVKVTRGECALHVVKRTGTPQTSDLTAQFEPLFATYTG